jgi:LPXTG-motif cell wall-anchored protein
MAFAAQGGSEQGPYIINDGTTNIEANLGSSDLNNQVVLSPSTTVASKADTTNADYVYNFSAGVIAGSDEAILDNNSATITITVDSKYANGYAAKLFADHHNGISDIHDQYTKTVNEDGTVTFTFNIESLSDFTFALYASSDEAASTTTTSTDSSSTSPKTGFDMGELALISGGLVVAAGATLVARKKVTA